MTNSTPTTSTRKSTIASVWADIRNGQRRLIEHNRPGAAQRNSR